MRHNISIDEVLHSLKKMMNVKSSRMQEYLNNANNVSNYDSENDEDALELTEVVFTNKEVVSSDVINTETEDKKNTSINDKKIEKYSDIKSKISEKTSSEVSMYLKYLSDKSATVSNQSKEKTINDFLMDAMMPYVMDWLDKNLSKLVKEIVEKEVRNITEYGKR